MRSHNCEPDKPRGSAFSELGRTAIAFAASGLVLALKAPDSVTRPQFWAEDGTIFFAQAHDHSLPRLFSPYAGYFLFLPRLVAFVAAPFSASQAPLIYSLGALVLGAAALASLRQIRALGVPFPLLLGAVLLTPTSVEVFGSLTNVQWLTQFGLLAIAARFWQGDETRHPMLGIILATLVGMTGVFCVFITIALGVCWSLVWLAQRATDDDRELSLLAERARNPPPEILVLVACAALQVACFVRSPDAAGLPGGAIGPALTGIATSVQSHLFCSAILPTGLFVTLVAGLVVLAVRGLLDRPTGLVVLVMTLIYVALQLGATTLKLRGDPTLLEPFDMGDRYFVAANAAIWWLVAIAVASAVPRSPRAAFLATTALLCTSAWATGHLQRPPLPDLEWSPYARSIDAGLDVTAPINPPPWTMHVPSKSSADDQAVAMQGGLDALYTRRDPEAAAIEFRKVLSANPSHYGAIFQLAIALDAAGRPMEARPYWEQALALAQGYADTETAERARLRLAASDVSSDEALMQQGLDALYARHDPAAAADEFRLVLVRNPTHYGATFQLASALDAAGQHAEARPLWEKMVAMAVAANDAETAAEARARLAHDVGAAPATAGGE